MDEKDLRCEAYKVQVEHMKNEMEVFEVQKELFEAQKVVAELTARKLRQEVGDYVPDMPLPSF